MLQFIHSAFEHVAPSLGASADEIKLIFSFLLSYPLAAIVKRLPDDDPRQKNIFIILVSCFYLVGLFDLWDGVVTILISAGGTYAIAKYLRTSPFMPWVGFAFLMGHMSISHIHRQISNDPSVIDITGAQMVLLMKLNAFCWNVADGLLPDDQLSDFQKDRRLVELPSILSYSSYVLFFPSLLVGPAFDYAEYQRWIDTTMFNIPANVDPAKQPAVRKQRKIPRSGTPAMIKLVTGLIWLGAFIFMSGKFSTEVLLNDRYLEFGIARRILVLHLVSLTARLKYYAVWTLTEGSCILAGLGYNGIDAETGKVKWNRLRNLDPLGVEAAQNVRAFLGGWNMNTNSWLRNYVYLRVTPRGKKPGFRASLITFTTSAFWHGFYPGYYMAFLTASVLQTSAKSARRFLRPLFLDPISGNPTSFKILYDLASFFTTQVLMDFTTAPFLLLTLDDSMTVWRRVYYYAIVVGVLAEIFFHLPGVKKYLRQLQNQRVQSGQKRRQIESPSIPGQENQEPVLGVSADLRQDLSEAVEELKQDALELRSQLQRDGLENLKQE